MLSRLHITVAHAEDSYLLYFCVKDMFRCCVSIFNAKHVDILKKIHSRYPHTHLFSYSELNR